MWVTTTIRETLAHRSLQRSTNDGWLYSAKHGHIRFYAETWANYSPLSAPASMISPVGPALLVYFISGPRPQAATA